MKKWALFTLIIMAIVSSLGCTDTDDGTPVISILKNDNHTSGDSVVFIAGFIISEEGAVTLGPVTGDFRVNKVLLLFGGNTDTQNVTLNIYYDTGSTNPGSLIYSADYQITGSNDTSTLHEISLLGDNLVVAGGGSIRVSIQFNHNGLPCIARDGGPLITGRNWIYSSGSWVDASTYLVTGNFIIRAEIERL